LQDPWKKVHRLCLKTLFFLGHLARQENHVLKKWKEVLTRALKQYA